MSSTEDLHKTRIAGIENSGIFFPPSKKELSNSLAPSVLTTSAVPLGADLLLKWRVAAELRKKKKKKQLFSTSSFHGRFSQCITGSSTHTYWQAWGYDVSGQPEGLACRGHAVMGDTVLHAEDSVSDICIEKCLPFVCSSPGTTQMWVQFF